MSAQHPSFVQLHRKSQDLKKSVINTKRIFFFNFFLFYYWWRGTKSLGTAVTSGLLYRPQMIDEGDCGAVGGMKIGRGNRSTRRKPASAPLRPPQIPHDHTRARNPGRQRLTAWAMARPNVYFITLYKFSWQQSSFIYLFIYFAPINIQPLISEISTETREEHSNASINFNKPTKREKVYRNLTCSSRLVSCLQTCR
jgi:hypothetical protein